VDEDEGRLARALVVVDELDALVNDGGHGVSLLYLSSQTSCMRA
jgi:hypothetical protein